VETLCPKCGKKIFFREAGLLQCECGEKFYAGFDQVKQLYIARDEDSSIQIMSISKIKKK